MGLYVNPTDGGTKEDWLTRFAVAEVDGAEITRDYAKLVSGDLIPLVWVHNGMFTALAVGFNQREVDDFARPDGRPKRFFVVPRAALAADISGVGEDLLVSHGLSKQLTI